MSRSKRKSRKKQQSKSPVNASRKNKVLQTEITKNAQVNVIKKQEPEVASSTLKIVWSSIKYTSLLVWTVIGSVSVIIGIIAIVQLSPRISVFPNESLDPSTPFSSPFIVSNDGHFSVYNVEFQCNVKNVGATDNIKIGGFSTRESRKTVSIMNPADKETTNCARGLFAPVSGQFENADVSIVVNFRAYWIPISQTRKFRFVTRKDTNGQLYWFPKATAE